MDNYKNIARLSSHLSSNASNCSTGIASPNK